MVGLDTLGPNNVFPCCIIQEVIQWRLLLNSAGVCVKYRCEIKSMKIQLLYFPKLTIASQYGNCISVQFILYFPDSMDWSALWLRTLYSLLWSFENQISSYIVLKFKNTDRMILGAKYLEFSSIQYSCFLLFHHFSSPDDANWYWGSIPQV